MRDVKDLTRKDLGAILYQYYLDNYCEDDFSFDKGIMRKQVESHLKSLNLTDDELDTIEEKIKLYEEDGTDYESFNLKFKEMPNMFLQVTSLIDYKGQRAGNYTGDCKWADVGMFFVDYSDCDFSNL